MKDDRELRLALIKHSVNVDGTALAQYLPYYQHQVQHWLDAKQRFYFFRALHGWLKNDVEKNHFKQRQTARTLKNSQDVSIYHNDRILLFIEHLPKYTPFYRYNASVILSTFQKEFPYYEAILQYGRLGVSLEGVTNKKGEVLQPWQLVNHWIIRRFVNLCQWQRSRYVLYEDWYYHRYSKELTDTMLTKHLKEIEHIDKLIRLSCGAHHYKMAFYTNKSVDINYVFDTSMELKINSVEVEDPYDNISL